MDRFTAYRRGGGGEATRHVLAAGSYFRARTAPDEDQIPRCPGDDETRSQTVLMTATIECMFTLC